MMKLITALLESLFGEKQCGGETSVITIKMFSPTHCSEISRLSNCGGDTTRVVFAPALPLDEALLHARKYKTKGAFSHRS